jgi:hypothetical protein
LIYAKGIEGIIHSNDASATPERETEFFVKTKKGAKQPHETLYAGNSKRYSKGN